MHRTTATDATAGKGDTKIRRPTRDRGALRERTRVGNGMGSSPEVACRGVGGGEGGGRG